MKNVILFMFGMVMIGIVIYLGLEANEDSSLIIWFGLAAAILAPTGLALMQYPFTLKDDVLIKRLSKIPEINQLIEKASTIEEKIKVLEKEKNRLAETVELEARKQFLKSKRESLITEAARLISQLKHIEDDLGNIDSTVSKSPVSKEVMRLRQIVSSEQRGDINLNIFGNDIIIPRSIVDTSPMFIFLYGYIKLVKRILKKLNL